MVHQIAPMPSFRNAGVEMSYMFWWMGVRKSYSNKPEQRWGEQNETKALNVISNQRSFLQLNYYKHTQLRALRFKAQMWTKIKCVTDVRWCLLSFDIDMSKWHVWGTDDSLEYISANLNKMNKLCQSFSRVKMSINCDEVQLI